MALQSQIEDYTGPIADGETALAGRAFTEGIHASVALVRQFDPDKLHLFATATSATGIPNDDTILEVRRGTTPAIEIPQHLGPRASDTGSIYYATDESPVYYKKNGSINIVPTGGTASIDIVETHASVDIAASGAGDLTFPDNWTILPTLYAAKIVLHRRLENQSITALATGGSTASMPTTVSLSTGATLPSYTLPTALNLSGVTALSAPNSTALSYTLASALGATAASIGNIGAELNYIAPTAFAFPTAIGITALSIQASAPTGPGVTGGYTAAGTAAAGTASVGTVWGTTGPNYSAPTASIPSFPSGDTALAILDVTSAASGISVPTLTLGTGTYGNATGAMATASAVGTLATAPAYSLATAYSPIDFPSGATALATLDITSEASGISVPSLTLGTGTYDAATGSLATASAVGTLATAPAYTAAGVSWFATGATGEQTHADWETLTKIIVSDEDAELAGAQTQKIQTILQKYQLDTQNNLNDFNKENAEYQAEIQKLVTNAQLAAQEYQIEAQLATDVSKQNQLQKVTTEMQNFSNDLQKYGADIQNYQAEVNANIQEWTQNEFQVKYQRWQIENANMLQQYQSDMQDALNIFNADNSRYQAEIQKAVTNAQLAAQEYQLEAQLATDVSKQNQLQKVTVEMKNFENDLQKYSVDIQNYQAEVNTNIQEWTQNEYQVKFSRWISECNNGLQEYQADIQNQLNKFNQDSALFQKDLQVAIADAQALSSKYLQDAQLATNVDLQNAAQASSAILQEEQITLSKYASEIQQYQAEVNAEVQEYTTNTLQYKLAEWSTDYGNKLQEYSARIQVQATDLQEQTGNYQIRVQKAIKQAELDIAKYTQDAQTATTTDLQNRAAEAAAEMQSQKDVLTTYQIEVQQYNAQLQKAVALFTNDLQQQMQDFSSEDAIFKDQLAKNSEENQSKLNKYTQEVQAYVADIQANVAEFGAKLQQATTEYQWIQGQLQSVAQEYTTQTQILIGIKQEANNDS
jgi:hypothetical protein